jgi:hypothetical protein
MQYIKFPLLDGTLLYRSSIMKESIGSQRLALIALIVSILSCVAGYLAIPKIQKLIGLDLPLKNPCADYGIKAISPLNGEEVSEEFQLSGTYTNKPPAGHILTFVIPSRENEYWPMYEVQLDQSNKSWTGQCDLRGESPKEAYCAVVLVGNAGRLMFDQYWKVGNERDAWVPLDKLPDDAGVCDKVFVQRTR